MHTLKKFFKDKWLEIAIIAIAIQLITNAISVFLGNRPLLIMFTAIGLILLIVLVTSASDAMKATNKIIGGVDLNIQRRGIIFTIGLKSHDANSTIMKVIKKLSPQYCGFIGTDRTIKANIGKTIAQSAGLQEHFYREKSVDPTNIREIREDTMHIIQWMLDNGLSTNDLVVDITGGTAIMSVAAYIAADEKRVDTQYIYSKYRDNKPVDGSQKALMVSRYETD
ncbi:MAG: hypothetical protein JRD93_09525 [Deltaproteobacteria bacterium]|nr:hypothetical protein [Deltaproteobacteria bacterium]